MSEHGAALQTYNQELVKCLEELKTKRCEIVDKICKEEADKVVLEKRIETLQNQLASLNQSLEQHKNVYESYDKIIKDTERGFKKVILESSHALLHVAQHESNKLECVNSKNANLMDYVNEPNY